MVPTCIFVLLETTSKKVLGADTKLGEFECHEVNGRFDDIVFQSRLTEALSHTQIVVTLPSS
jgi:hypothetical protein